MRDKYLRLQRDKENQMQGWNKEKEDLQQTISELKLTQLHLREPAELIQE